MNYQTMVKGKRYSYRNGRRVRSGKYLGRYFNKSMQRWYYHFEICLGMYHTPAACETRILSGGEA